MKTYFFLIISFFLLNDCSLLKETGNEKKSASFYYKKGRQYLENENYLEAAAGFNAAIKQDSLFVPAYEGFARLHFMKNDIRIAELYLNRASKINENWPPAIILKGRIELYKRSYSAALEYFNRALFLINKIDDTNLREKLKEEVLFCSGTAFQKSNRLQSGRKMYIAVLEINQDNEKAMNALNTIEHDLELLQGKNNIIKRIARKQAINRGDLAVLMVTEPGIYQDIPALEIQDFDTLNACIKKVLNLGIMELYPDSAFKAQRRIKRAELALIVERIVSAFMNNSRLTYQYFKEKSSPVTDVDTYQPYYNAMRLATINKLMTFYDDDTFRPDNYVSGLEALRIMKRTKEFLMNK